MDYRGVFASSILATVIMNLIMSFISNEYSLISLTTLIGFISGIALTGLVMGVQALTFALSETAQKLIISLALVVNIMFQLDIVSFTLPGASSPTTFAIGIGLISNLLDLFADGDLFGLGLILCGTLSVMILVSGVLMVTESA